MIEPFLLIQLKKNNPNFYELFFLDPDDGDISTLHEHICNNTHVRVLMVNTKKKLRDKGKETLALIEEIVNKNKAVYSSKNKINDKLVLTDTAYYNLIAYFNEEFYIAKAENPEIKKKMHTLRHETFVEEKKWRALNNNSIHERLEIDEYDEHSDFRVVIKKDTNEVVGTVRCVLPNASKGNNSFHLMDTFYEKNRVFWEFCTVYGKYMPYKEGVHIKSSLQQNRTASFWSTKQAADNADSLSEHNLIESPRAKL